jgi:hypothetical protein
MTMPPLVDWLAARGSAWRRAGEAALDAPRSRYSHVLLTTPDRRTGFALFGGFKTRHRIAAVYLPAGAPSRTRVVFHRPATAAVCRALAARWGLVAFCGASAPAGLEDAVLSLPFDVGMEMPTPLVFEGPAAGWTRSAKANLARVRRGGFSSDVVPGGDLAAEFLRRMHRAAMRAQHGPKAYPAGGHEVRRFAREDGSELLRVFKDGRWVAGSLNRSTPDGYRLWIMGWQNGDAALRRQGVVSAVYWFNFHRAAALGHRRILLGGVDPYLEDGILQYKAHWGATLSEPRWRSRLGLLLDPSHPACARFLRARSIVTCGADGRYIVFSGKPPEAVDVSPAILRGIARWYVWRDTPSGVPDVKSDDVPASLRPWVSAATR